MSANAAAKPRASALGTVGTPPLALRPFAAYQRLSLLCVFPRRVWYTTPAVAGWPYAPCGSRTRIDTVLETAALTIKLRGRRAGARCPRPGLGHRIIPSRAGTPPCIADAPPPPRSAG